MDGKCTLCTHDEPATCTIGWLCHKYPVIPDGESYSFGISEVFYNVESGIPLLWLCAKHEAMWMRGEIPEGGG